MIPQVVVANKGSREHYLAPRALHRRGMLAQLIVDWYPPFYSRRLVELGLGAFSRSFGRACEEIPSHLIQTMRSYALRDYWRRVRARKADRLGEAYLEAGREFATRVSKLHLPAHDAFFCFSASALEAIDKEKTAGALTILHQLDPGPFEYDLVAEEARRWPQYTKSRWPPQHALHQRLLEEWTASDVIIVNSDWSREAISARGADPAKIEVVPLAYESPVRSPARRRALPPPLSVVWLGRIAIQKGIQYLIEAARQLLREPIEFLIGGDSDVPAETMRSSPLNVRWLGKLTPGQAQALLSSGHVFVLPTLSDGFALTQLEAFAHGLPVITTKRCGRVVEHGRTGLLVEPGDSQGLADAILEFLRNPGLTEAMAPRCVAALMSYSLERYSDRLIEIIERRRQRALSSKPQ